MVARFRILGRTGLLIGNRVDEQWGQRKPRGLLAALLLNPGRAVTLDTLVEWIWPLGKAPGQPASTLYTYVHRVREELGRMEKPPLLIPTGGGYRLEVDKSEVDFYVFRDLVERARLSTRQGEHATAKALLISAAELWTDHPVADLDSERADRWRHWAKTEQLIPAIAALVHEYASLGEFDEALRQLDELPVEHQTNLTVIKLRLEALFGLHRGKEATTYFLNRRKRLLEDFDQPAADELTRFHDRFGSTGSVSSPGPAHSQPPMDTAPAPSYLPRDITDFVGREDLLRRLDQIIPSPEAALPASITVLEGQPGIGKSALAVHWATRSSDRFPDGQLYLDLNGFSNTPIIDPATAVERLLLQLEFPTARTTTTDARKNKLRSLLAGRRMLVLLDNVRNSTHIEPLIDFLPCAVLITSQRHLSGLGRRGAAILPVPPLSYPDGRNLLARRLGPRADAEPGAVSALTGMCGGNTLELRLVAEHVARRPHVRLAEFVEELREEHALLDLGDDDDNPGGSTRATFSVSYQALSSDEQRMFRLLGTHPGPDISLDAAAALMGTDRPWVKRRLDALVDTHLLTQPEERARYRLHDLLRRYAAECVAQAEYGDERHTAEQRILSYYHHGAHNADMKIFPHGVELPTLPLVDNVTPPEFYDARAAMAWLVRERVNLNAIIHFASNRQMHEYVTIMSSSTGEAYQRLGYCEDVLFRLRVAVRSAESSGNRLGHGYSLHNLGVVQLRLRDFASAESNLRSAEVIFREVGLREGMAGATINLARLGMARGDHATAIQRFGAALTALRDLDSPQARWLEVNGQYRMAEAFRLSNDHDAAIVSATEALRLADRMDDDRARASSFTELAWIYFANNDPTRAKGYCLESLKLNKQHPEAELAGRNWHLLGRIHHQAGKLDLAERCLRVATMGYRDARDPQGEAAAYDQLGAVLLALGHTEYAAGAWSRAVAVLEDMHIYDDRVDAIRIRLAELSIIPPALMSESTHPLTGYSKNITHGENHS